VQGERSPIMPGFAASMDDAQIAVLMDYLRARFSSAPAWTGLENTVAEARRGQALFLQTTAERRNAPADPAQRDKP
jgi:cytochrome c553